MAPFSEFVTKKYFCKRTFKEKLVANYMYLVYDFDIMMTLKTIMRIVTGI